MNEHIKDIDSLIDAEVTEALCYRYSLPKRRGRYTLPQVWRSPESSRRRLSRILEPEGWLSLFIIAGLITVGGYWLSQLLSI
jgi:hypothetical protein